METNLQTVYSFVIRESDQQYTERIRAEQAAGITPVEDEDITVERNEIDDCQWLLDISVIKDENYVVEVFVVQGQRLKVDVKYTVISDSCYKSERTSSRIIEIPDIANTNDITVEETVSGVLEIRSYVLNPFLRKRIRTSTHVANSQPNETYQIY